MKHPFLIAGLFAVVTLCSSWGFYAHMRINRLAVFTLPADINPFYKAHIKYLSDHAVDPDKRRYADTAEAARHYLDVELYANHIDSIPRKWEDAVKRYGLAKLGQDGILPWQIQKSYYQLVNAFKDRDSLRILIYSAYLGHYLADAHVPLHTTQNHNGQLSNQLGIHAFWESRLPELFEKKYNYVVGQAVYIENPLKEAWKIITHSHQLVDTVLLAEAKLNARFPGHLKYGFSERNNQVSRQYSLAYSKAFHEMLNHMVEQQMRSAILSTGSYWYSAWIDAGQPVLKNLVNSKTRNPARQTIEKAYRKGRIIGREN
ncbi:zinc dependent phospholipase C family protein [Pedobacter heparinus]|uniref:zinc dependent phospholipase C family protein n=1 Tax=Pedobacter heparinus TaxID=984 RepID=UPI00292D80A8|nr:zinc dependent phospholipase C family protein [Pedobacter heparinus]